jgi:hypothetical protein
MNGGVACDCVCDDGDVTVLIMVVVVAVMCSSVIDDDDDGSDTGDDCECSGERTAR